MTTHALATAPAEPVEGPEALKAYLERRIELFEQFKLRESEAVQLFPPGASDMIEALLLRLHEHNSPRKASGHCKQ